MNIPRGGLLLAALFVAIGVYSALDAFQVEDDLQGPPPPPHAVLSGNRWSISVTADAERFEPSISALPPGGTAIDLIVTGESPHELQIFQLSPGVSFDAFRRTVSRVGYASKLLSMAVPVGGVGAGGGVAPGTTQRVVLDMAIGTYGFVSFVNNDHQRGFIERFEVNEGVPTPVGTPPIAADLVMQDEAFQLSAPVPASGVLRVVNQGADVHEAAVFQLDGSVEELIEELRDGTSTGGPGFGSLAPGKSMFAQTGLEPGSYAFVCRVRDGGKAHYQQGMITEFEVR